jgi:hypothetical protein
MVTQIGSNHFDGHLLDVGILISNITTTIQNILLIVFTPFQNYDGEHGLNLSKLYDN